MKTFLNQFAGVTALFVLLMLGAESALSAADGPRSGRPNVIIIYSDDHGYTDLGLFGIDSSVDTPNMDRLARDGALMSNGYCSAPQCRPSRCGLMAGRIQNEFGFGYNHANPGEGKGNMPRTYPAGTDMAGQPLLTIADRMKALGYVTGFSGKWHCGTNDDKDGKYDPRGRGFDEYLVGLGIPAFANIDLDGKKTEHRRIDTWPGGINNRVILQGKYAETFIERNKDKKFFLYFPIFGPHLPRIDLDDPYYKKFPKVDYPHYNDEQDDIRRQGLALLKAMDDSIGGVVRKLRDLGLEENTLIFFAGDNGAPTKLRTGRGTPDVNGWNGSCNVPMRGNKGNLLEGGIRVPMFAYWKGTIPAGQLLDEMVTTLDFTATTLSAGGGDLPPEFDGVNILPRLTGKASSIPRTQPMFWDFYESQAVRMGDWKLFRNASGDRLFNIANDPSELTNVIRQYPERARELAAELDEWASTLRPDSTAALEWDDSHWSYALSGAPPNVKADPRYLIPYDNPLPQPYPAPIAGPPLPHGKGAPGEKPKEKSKVRPRVRSKEKSSEESAEKSLGKPSEVVDGWAGSGACALFRKEGQLVVKCSGDRAFFRVLKLEPLEGGPFTLKCRMKSNALRRLSLFYNKPSRDRLVNLRLKLDDSFHEYEAEIRAEALEDLRFNPAKAEGMIEVDWLRILDNTGKTVQSWEF